ncbi:hypothetical protein [Glycomyces algeriensis]|uniref:Uncharacterized protein n=1 Tax=Glycomyces algeriensis TaxID=256037 RepID=A0A9W6G3W0_9ACTN|nr:hypothetical protein [Glycomyces algeriensis]MDA1368892.1 hypothetical protein [Glycomyces algeriensis]MDR7352834.1 hypothetical protein [Glycomyces algeriensis]GLI40520.1 hypothetical protein GALLR39Z86_03700 [Glycomyces algeriensis]
MTFEPDDDKVAAAFASFKADAAAQFPAPPVNELLGRAPAAKRRRRLVSLAAIAGACTAVTAGGFAVAQTIGPIAFGPEPSGNESTSVEAATSDETPSFSIGDPASPHSSGGEEPTEEIEIPAETTLVITDPGAYGEPCADVSLGLNVEDWTFTDETPWAIAFDAEAGVGPVLGDVNGDGVDDVAAVLECRSEGAEASTTAGVAAFAWNENGTSLEQLGWVWEPKAPTATVAITAIEDGVVTVDAVNPGFPDQTGSFQYAWNAETEAFAPVADDPPATPTPSESSPSTPPNETPTADESAAATASSGS